MRYHYCPKCGGRLKLNEQLEKNKPICEQCRFVFYQNPIVGVAAIVIKDQQLLLGKRNSSYKDKWCIPCGYVEYDEDVYDAVQREFNEETGLQIQPRSVYDVQSNFHNPKQHTVGIWFLADVVAGTLAAGDDLDDVDYFDTHRLPELAFPTDRMIINKLKEGRLIR
ncbi:nucleotide triphosphate diphosphatase NUDT15 [Desertibacillus haloalkaliphilus]|uniref:nucleotide triphosphate diphosphatase NUDT15 n=1 Tax=Desertibacillus haloalkaliphilus TaxID=1328930 RepID=UPI001C2692D4|nr:NUDIX hydrolase [Desertibacillus haloalkaliphilus]